MKQRMFDAPIHAVASFPLHFAGASLKRADHPTPGAGSRRGFPLHFAGASLKQECHRGGILRRRAFSPAFRGGLIEASR